jgi:integrase
MGFALFHSHGIAMKTNITKALIEATPLPEQGSISIQDTKVSGLYLRLSASGARTWNVFKWNRAHRRPMRVSIGPYPSVGVDQARSKATQIVAAIDQGRDLAAEREQRFAQPTLGELSVSYSARLKATKHRHSAYLHTLVINAFKDWLNRRVDTITQREISARHDLIAASRGPVAAARAVKALRTLFNHAERDLGSNMRNVARGVRVKDSKPRGRYMTKEEEAKLQTVLAAEPAFVQDYVRLLLLTGARRDNVAGLRWSDVNWPERVWRIPGDLAKAGEAIEIPLVPEAIAILERRYKEHKETGFCFPSRGRKGRLLEVWFMWRRIKARAILLDAGLDWRCDKPHDAIDAIPENIRVGLRDLTIHDLRRTVAVRLVSAGASLPVIGAALGHRNLKTTQQVYALATRDDVRAAMERAL